MSRSFESLISEAKIEKRGCTRSGSVYTMHIFMQDYPLWKNTCFIIFWRYKHAISSPLIRIHSIYSKNIYNCDDYERSRRWVKHGIARLSKLTAARVVLHCFVKADTWARRNKPWARWFSMVREGVTAKKVAQDYKPVKCLEKTKNPAYAYHTVTNGPKAIIFFKRQKHYKINLIVKIAE